MDTTGSAELQGGGNVVTETPLLSQSSNGVHPAQAVEPEDPFQEAADGHQGHGEVDSGQHHCNGGWMELVGSEEGGRFSFGYLLSCKVTNPLKIS